MTRNLFTIVLAVSALVFLVTRAPSAELDTSVPVVSSGGPVVVELFTSEGCSSCPPADRLFSRLAGDVVALGFHVDYWNHLGWRDPFSDARWSQRQRRYSEVLGRGYVYTPQLVVDGRVEAVGSDLRQVETMLREAAARPRKAELEMAVTEESEAFTVLVEADLAKEASPSVLLVAITESDLEVDIAAGENAHRTLPHEHVVRELLEVGRVDPGAREERTVNVKLDPSWKRGHLEVVALLQDEESREIYGAARWAPEPQGAKK